MAKGRTLNLLEEKTKADLKQTIQAFRTVGVGTENDRAAQIIIQTISVLEKRLGDPTAIKTIYLDNPYVSKLIPKTIYEVIQQYVGGEITEQEARERLQFASKQYSDIFQEMGIVPRVISGVTHADAIKLGTFIALMR